jgi:predicted  nucleic acid-binding Zn-ribbon protein
MDEKKKNIDNYISAAETYIRTHPDTTGTTNAMIALTISIQQVENQAKQLNKNIEKFDQTSSELSTRLVSWTKTLAVATIVLAVATVALVVINFS